MIKKTLCHFKTHYYFFLRTKRPFSTCPLPLYPPNPSSLSSTPEFQHDHKCLCFLLVDKLINRGLLPSAQKVIQRLIFQSSSVPQAISVVDFANQRGIELDCSCYTALIRKLVDSNEPQLGLALYNDEILSRGIEPDSSLLNSIVVCFCKLGLLDEAKCDFDRLIGMKFGPCLGTCKGIIREFCAQDRFLEAFECFVKGNDCGILFGFWCYNMLVDGLCFKGYLDEALHVFDVMRERGVPPTIRLCKSLVIGFCKRGRVEEAELLSTEMESCGLVLDKVMYTSLIHEYCKGKKMKMAMRVFLRMLKMGCAPDNFTYNTLIHGFVNLGLFDKGWVLHNQMEGWGLKPDVVTYHIMISKYCKDQKVDGALMLLNNMKHWNITPPVHCYTVLIAALHKENRLAEVDELFNNMLDSGVVPDHVLFFILIKKCPKGDELFLTLLFLQAVAKNGCGYDYSSFSSSATSRSIGDVELDIEHLLGEIVGSNLRLADMAFSIYLIALCVAGKIDSALLCMDKMASLGCQPLLSAYNSLIKCLCQEGLFEDAKSLIELMQDRGLVPNRATYLIMVNEHCKQGDSAFAFDVLDQMDERGVKPSVAIYDSIIGCLSREKRIFEAQGVFKRMLETGVYPDHTAYVTMINAYSKNGRAIEACQLFNQMLEHGLQPSSHTYTALIYGLVKKNMTEKGCLYLDRMLEEGFLPNAVLYTSLINQFLRKREFKFAFRLMGLMEKSQIEGDLITYITLVSGVSRNLMRKREKWHVPHIRSEKAKEMLFHLLHQRTIVPWESNLKLSISSRKQLKFFALKLIQKIRDIRFMPNLYLYNGLISGFCWAERMQDAYNHLELMQREGVHPNQVTFTILIDGHIQFGETDLAVGLFNQMNAKGYVPDRMLYNTLIKGLCKARRLLDALSLLHTMRKRGFSPCKASYENVLSCLCASHLSLHALKLCEDMLAHDYFPCRYNLNWLLYLLYEENKLTEVSIIHDMMFKRGRSLDEMIQRCWWNHYRSRDKLV